MKADIPDLDQYSLQFQSVVTVEPGTLNLEPICLEKETIDFYF
jgi:hypothetical protein